VGSGLGPGDISIVVAKSLPSGLHIKVVPPEGE